MRLAILEAPIEALAQARDNEIASLTLTFSRTDWPAYAALNDNRTIRVQREGNQDASMWRVLSIADIADDDTVTVQCEALYGDLARTALLIDVLDHDSFQAFGRTGMTPADAVDLCLSGYEGMIGFDRGDVALTKEIQIASFDTDTAYSALAKIRDVALGRLRFEWRDDVRRYRVHLDDVNAPAIWNGAEVRPGKNLLKLTRTIDGGQRATRFAGKGGDGISLADVSWVVADYTATSITLTTGNDTKGPVPAPGWLVGARVRAAGTLAQGVLVLASTGTLDTPGVLSLAAGHGIVAGDRVEFMDGDITKARRLSYLEHPSISVYGPRLRLVDAPEIPRYANFLTNPALSQWSTPGVPDGWEVVGTPGITQDTTVDYLKYGTRAPHIVASAAGQGLRSVPFIYRKNERYPVFTANVSLVMLSGNVSVRIVNDVTGVAYPVDLSAYAKYTPINGDPAPVMVGVHEQSAPDGRYRVVIASFGGAADFIVNGATATITADGSFGDVVLTGGDHLLWWKVANVALTEWDAASVYVMEMENLYRLAPTEFPNDRVRVGDALRVFEPDLGVAVEVRVSALTESLLNASVGTVELSAQRKDQKSLLGAGQSFPPRGASAKQTERIGPPTANIEGLDNSITEAQRLRLSGALHPASTGTLQWRTRMVGGSSLAMAWSIWRDGFGVDALPREETVYRDVRDEVIFSFQTRDSLTLVESDVKTFKALPIGNVPGANGITKTIRIPAISLMNYDPVQSCYRDPLHAFLNADGASVNLVGNISQLPRGVTVTAIRMTAYRRQSDAAVFFNFLRTANDGLLYHLASGECPITSGEPEYVYTPNGQITTSTVTQLLNAVLDDGTFVISAHMDNGATGGPTIYNENAALYWFELDYIQHNALQST
jgi:hypothetical protein